MKRGSYIKIVHIKEEFTSRCFKKRKQQNNDMRNLSVYRILLSIKKLKAKIFQFIETSTYAGQFVDILFESIFKKKNVSVS